MDSINRGDTEAVKKEIETFLSKDIKDDEADFLLIIQDIISGNRDVSLAQSKDLHYECAVELHLLLEGVEA